MDGCDWGANGDAALQDSERRAQEPTFHNLRSERLGCAPVRRAAPATPAGRAIITWPTPRTFHDCIRYSQRRRATWRLDRRGVHHCALYRRWDLDGMRNSRLPLTGWIVGASPPDPVRRIRGQSGCPDRGVAAAFRHGGGGLAGAGRARAARAWLAVPG